MALAERLLTEFPKYPTISSIIRLVISCRTGCDAEENHVRPSCNGNRAIDIAGTGSNNAFTKTGQSSVSFIFNVI